MGAVKDRLMKLEEAYSFFRDPEIGNAIDTILLMESRINVLEEALRDVLTYYVTIDGEFMRSPKAIDNAWRVLEEGIV